MLTVTEAACGLVDQLLHESQAPQGTIARIIASPDGLSLVLDEPKNDDLTFDHEGKPVLAIAQHVSEAIPNHAVDVQETDEGPQLKLVSMEDEA